MDIYEVKVNGKDTWYLKNNIIHRDGDLPAREFEGGGVWYKNGLVHREGDLPAMIDLDQKSWYKNGLVHREGDLPAIIVKDGEKQYWYKEGKQHRIGAPAFIQKQHSCYMGYEEWWFEGKKHREDGPAVTFADGRKEWWIDGRQVPEEDFEQELIKRKLHSSLQEELVPLEKKYKKTKI
jgi:hypothetical protein